jgi:hypothetical protein
LKRKVSSMIDKYGVEETLRRGRESFEKDLAKIKTQKKPSHA